jgi:hypothetical protein
MSYQATQEYQRDALIYATGVLDGMIDRGIVRGPRLLSPEDKARFYQLIRENFTPVEQDLFEAIALLRSKFDESDWEILVDEDTQKARRDAWSDSIVDEAWKVGETS